MSSDPYNNRLEHKIILKGTHKTLGMQLITDNISGRIKLKQCLPGTPSARLPKWRSELRNSTILTINGEMIKDVKTVEQIIRTGKKSGKKDITVVFGTMDKISLHPSHGVPQMHFDQLNVVAHHLHQMKGYECNDCTDKTGMKCEAHIKKAKSAKRFTRRVLQQRQDWEAWQKAEYKMHDDYEKQDMFGEPCRLPKGANVLPFYWDYSRKPTGEYKARCVVNGAPTQKGSVTLAQTYAASLEQPGQRLFWATVANESLYAVGSDATNAFAEAPPPVAELYILIDEPYRNWWVNHKKRKPIPKGMVLPVKHAIQGHPESPRLWQQHIDGFLKQMKFESTTHEPCLYKGVYKQHRVLFMRQVDDFAIASDNLDICQEIISQLDNAMTIKIKDLGLISRYNGTDVEQTREYIKIHSESYITKI